MAIIKRIALAILIAISTNSNLTHCWQWPWTDNTEIINLLADKFHNDVSIRTVTDYLQANQRAINKIQSDIQWKPDYQLSKANFHEKDPRDEINRRERIKKRIEEDGLNIIINLRDEKGILEQKDFNDIKRISRINAEDFEKALVGQYGRSNTSDYWYEIQKVYLSRIDEQEKERTKK